MPVSILKVRLGTKAQVVLPKEARQALGLKPGDTFAFVIDGDDVRVVRAPADGDDPFACFSEWASDADRKGMPTFDQFDVVRWVWRLLKVKDAQPRPRRCSPWRP